MNRPLEFQSLEFQDYGSHAVLISWPNVISEKTSRDIYLFNQKINALLSESIVEIVTAYCSLTVFVNTGIDKQKLIINLKKIYRAGFDDIEVKSKIWDIPVCYDLSLGIDLKNLAKAKNISVEEIIQLHTQPLYTVDFIGFLPGFPYLSGLNPLLNTPRLENPRQNINKGSVAIGGKQTGVYPIDSPGGWHIIGRTPFTFFNPQKTNPCVIKAMDKIKFHAISLDEYYHD